MSILTEHSQVTAVNALEMAEVLRQAGFAPEIAEAGDGKPMITFEVWELKSILHFYGDQGGSAPSVQFRAIFGGQFDPFKVNDWNRRRRFVKAYLDDEGNLFFDMDVDLDGGVSKDHCPASPALGPHAGDGLWIHGELRRHEPVVVERRLSDGRVGLASGALAACPSPHPHLASEMRPRATRRRKFGGSCEKKRSRAHNKVGRHDARVTRQEIL